MPRLAALTVPGAPVGFGFGLLFGFGFEPCVGAGDGATVGGDDGDGVGDGEADAAVDGVTRAAAGCEGWPLQLATTSAAHSNGRARRCTTNSRGAGYIGRLRLRAPVDAATPCAE